MKSIVLHLLCIIASWFTKRHTIKWHWDGIIRELKRKGGKS